MNRWAIVFRPAGLRKGNAIPLPVPVRRGPVFFVDDGKNALDACSPLPMLRLLIPLNEMPTQ